MVRLLLIFIFGFLAQFVDGALGMGYGVTSCTLLISIGIFPAIASASVHTAEVVVSLVSGVSHFKLGNVRKDIFWPLTVLGMCGGALGAFGLVTLPVRPVRLVVGFILLVMGGVIFYRFKAKDHIGFRPNRRYSPVKLSCLGFFGGFFDAMGGGGWGPICTPSLVATGTEPRKAIGSVNFAEFFVTVAEVLTFILLIGPEKFRWDLVFILMIAGVIAAPIAAWICKKLPHKILGMLLGLAVVILSIRIILRAIVG
ncbi:MAG: sulfite exporter TauE/SafE family protein [Candidatus Omnitrophica bacterium]|nr:sulfite exporter TauE/SafE family protein [Candidatus Omnitrophota bacterium]